MIKLLRDLAFFSLSACLIRAQEATQRTSHDRNIWQSIAAAEEDRIARQRISQECNKPESGDQVVPQIAQQDVPKKRKFEGGAATQRSAAHSQRLIAAFERARRVFNPDNTNT
ncbi:MAG: hypothetical protein K2X90_01485 [Candidatus Babeliaceae bacterium]|nr:hypothetical protein [Candidatus Babeliaceae bacterium]